MSSYELIDVIDENDTVLRTIERTPEWNKERPTPFRVVNVLVFNDEGKLLVQQRSRKKSAGPLLFDTSVGGLVVSGMSYEETAHKEMEEELGITGDLSFVTTFKDYRRDGRFFSMNGLYTLKHNGPFSNWEKEAERLEWMTLEEVSYLVERFPYLFTPGFIRAISTYLEFSV